VDNNKPMHDDEEPIISLIQQIKDGTLNPKTLSREIRQCCVEFLSAEGYGAAQISQIIMRSEKTVSRDLVDIRARNAITPNIDLAKQIVGDMFQKAMVHHKYLMRIARSPDSSNAEKYQSEFLAWRVLKEVVEKMQTLGYLPLKPQEIVEDIFHHVSGENDIADAKNMLSEIEIAAKEAGTLNPETEEKIKALKRKIEQAEIKQEVTDLTKKEDKPKDQKEE